jgi:tetratricopeptide (TPR) repeat protein
VIEDDDEGGIRTKSLYQLYKILKNQNNILSTEVHEVLGSILGIEKISDKLRLHCAECFLDLCLDAAFDWGDNLYLGMIFGEIEALHKEQFPKVLSTNDFISGALTEEALRLIPPTHVRSLLNIFTKEIKYDSIEDIQYLIEQFKENTQPQIQVIISALWYTKGLVSELKESLVCFTQALRYLSSAGNSGFLGIVLQQLSWGNYKFHYQCLKDSVEKNMAEAKEHYSAGNYEKALNCAFSARSYSEEILWFDKDNAREKLALIAKFSSKIYAKTGDKGSSWEWRRVVTKEKGELSERKQTQHKKGLCMIM